MRRRLPDPRVVFAISAQLGTGNTSDSPAHRLYADDLGINQIAAASCMVIGEH
jgi:hypothetical protein